MFMYNIDKGIVSDVGPLLSFTSYILATKTPGLFQQQQLTIPPRAWIWPCPLHIDSLETTSYYSLVPRGALKGNGRLDQQCGVL